MTRPVASVDEKPAYVLRRRCDTTNATHSREIVVRGYGHDMDVSQFLEMIEDFMRACGYAVEMGTLEIKGAK